MRRGGCRDGDDPAPPLPPLKERLGEASRLSHTIWRIVFLVVPIALVAAFVFRPTPIVGVDGGSLAASVGVPVGDARFEPCREAGELWKCSVPGEGQSTPPLDLTLELDWLGCWKPAKTGGRVGAPPTPHGCVTLMDHVEAIE